MKKIAKLFSALLCVMALGACSTPKNVAYFQNEETIINDIKSKPIVVRPGDKISIVVKSKDASISALFNLPVYSTRVGTVTQANGSSAIGRDYTASANDGIAAYNVDPQGCIDFPMLGTLKVEGMTRSELAGFIKGELMGRDLVNDPVVNVEFINTGVNIMGEVVHPGRYDLNSDDLNILQALTLAGDLTLNGQRENVKVLREENGSIKVYTLNLTDLKSITSSPAYYLQQDDVIYVEPNEMRKRATTVNANSALSVSFWISVASLITTAVTTVGVFVTK